MTKKLTQAQQDALVMFSTVGISVEYTLRFTMKSFQNRARKLEANGLIARFADEKRGYVFRVTDAGRAALAQR